MMAELHISLLKLVTQMAVILIPSDYSFTGPSSTSCQQNSLSYVTTGDDKASTNAEDSKWRRSDPNPVRATTGMASVPAQHSKKMSPSTGEAKHSSESEQTGVLHVDTGYYSVRQGEQKRSSSYGSTYTQNTSTSSLLQVDDERWRQQQGKEDQKFQTHQQTDKQLISHEQLDRRYYPGYENRRSFDIAEQTYERISQTSLDEVQTKD